MATRKKEKLKLSDTHGRNNWIKYAHFECNIDPYISSKVCLFVWL